jgi:hypothetical protein
MTRIVTTTYRYKPPPRKRKAAPLAGPAVVTPKRKPTVAKKLEPAAAIVRKARPCNDNRPDVEPPPTIVRTAQPSRAVHTTPEDNKKPAIVTTASRKKTEAGASARQREDRPKDPAETARLRAWLERAKWGRGPREASEEGEDKWPTRKALNREVGSSC